MTSFVKINGPMVIAGKPVSERDNFVRFPALGFCQLRSPINGVTVLDEMPYDIRYKNWRRLTFPENALVEVDGTLTIKDGVRTITAKSLRV